MPVRTASLRASIRRLPFKNVCRRCLHATPACSQLDLTARVQSYVSTSRDPYLNLSIEHHLLQKSAAESTILFLYTNRPCIVIGRNQNPWVEVNLPLLRATNEGRGNAPAGLSSVDLVRRRSGGGTVFHDEGNINWSVICPSADFNRDKHAEMVVRALRSLGIDRARVNERHDIVLDQGPAMSDGQVDPEDTHRSRYNAASPGVPRPLKVSGSAYKLTRLRSLHHATCLLSSPNLAVIPQYLHSPARAYIKARGVESVSSPVGNIGVDEGRFSTAVREQFGLMYGGQIDVVRVGEKLLGERDIAKGYQELKSADWVFGQTPQFDLHSDPLSLTVRHGVIDSITRGPTHAGRGFGENLVGQSLYGELDWELLDRVSASVGREGASRSQGWLRDLLEVPC